MKMARMALWGLIITLLLAPLAWAQPASEEFRLISLDEAIAIAFDNSLSLQMSRLNVEEAELNLAQVQATNLVQPSPTALIQAERQLEIAQRQLLLDQFDLKLEVEEADRKSVV